MEHITRKFENLITLKLRKLVWNKDMKKSSAGADKTFIGPSLNSEIGCNWIDWSKLKTLDLNINPGLN